MSKEKERQSKGVRKERGEAGKGREGKVKGRKEPEEGCQVLSAVKEKK